MNRQNLAFLVAGLAFGVLIGFGSYNVVSMRPELSLTAASGSVAPGPQGPKAANPAGPNAGGGAPMVAEINRLKTILQENPKNEQVLLRLANLYHDAAMWKQAVGYYERAAELQPQDPDLLTDLGVSYRGMREFDRALESFARANAARPDHWQSLFNTVIVAGWDTGQFEVARKALGAIEALKPRPSELPDERLEELRRALDARAAGGPEEAS